MAVLLKHFDKVIHLGTNGSVQCIYEFNNWSEDDYLHQGSIANARNIGWRLDYFFVSKALKGNVKHAKILPEVFGSDHCPILLDLDI